jgi:transposase
MISPRLAAVRIRPALGFLVLLLSRMRRVDCTACGVRVEELPWAIGKHQLKGLHAVPGPLGAQTVVAGNRDRLPHQLVQGLPGGRMCGGLGLEHRELGPIQAIGVDEIQYAKGHKYLTLAYQIEQGCTRIPYLPHH